MSVENPLFSVVVPVYNNEKYIDECLSSLVNQTEKNIEIIVVDDGSTDSSGAICEKWADKDSRITVIHKENGGVVSACKSGYEISKGEYFSKVDSDDWVSTDFFEKVAECARAENLDVIITDFITEPQGETISTKFKKNYVTNGCYLIKEHGSVHTSNDICFSCRMFFRIDFLKKNNLFFPDGMKIGEDTAFNILALKYADKIIALDYAGYHYRIDNCYSVMSKKYKESLYKDISEQYKIRKDCFNNIDSYVKDMSVYYVKNIFFSVLRNCINSPQGLRYKDVKCILNSDWLVDSYKVLGFDFPFDSTKEKIMALALKFRLAFLYYIYIKYWSK